MSGNAESDVPPNWHGGIALILSELEVKLHSIYSYVTDVNEFQLSIFWSLLAICCANIFFICLAWKNYGKRISERFMKPATNKIIEELKKEATDLKLPKEHTPRI